MPAMTRSAKKGASVVGAVAGAVAAPFALAAQSIANARQQTPGAAGGGGRAELAKTAPAQIVPRLDYGSLRMAPASSHERGRLVASPPGVDDALVAKVNDASACVARLPLPPGHDADWSHAYDYAFASDGAVDIASDGAWHSIALTSRPGSAKVRHVAVPREQADVFRVATITNPLDGPLLPGPIDVYDRGQFLVTSHVDFTSAGGTVEVGLGVDAGVKIARNTEFREETAGMLKGKLELHHKITIDVENLSTRAITVEVRERVPITREGDDEVTVAVGKVDPPWESWAPEPDGPHDAQLKGAHRWIVDVAPRTKKVLRAAYDIRIAGKHELVGGNRREP